MGDMSAPYKYRGPSPQPGDRIGRIGADGEMHIDIMPDPADAPSVDLVRRLATRLESIQNVIRELLEGSDS
jgi:hypothetical protein